MSVKTWLATTRHGLVHATCDAHERWSVAALLTDQMVTCLAADPLNRAVVYAGTQGNGVLRSADGGQTWHSAGLAGQIVKALAVSQTQPGTLYAGTKPARLFISHTGGRHWDELVAFRRIRARWLWFSPAEKPYTAYVQAIALSPTDPQTVLVGCSVSSPFLFGLSTGTNGFPLPDARSVYLDPNPLGCDLAAANKVFSQQQRVVRCKSPQVAQREH